MLVPSDMNDIPFDYRRFLTNNTFVEFVLLILLKLGKIIFSIPYHSSDDFMRTSLILMLLLNKPASLLSLNDG